jgi:hypothetical protein
VSRCHQRRVDATIAKECKQVPTVVPPPKLPKWDWGGAQSAPQHPTAPRPQHSTQQQPQQPIDHMSQCNAIWKLRKFPGTAKTKVDWNGIWINVPVHNLNLARTAVMMMMMIMAVDHRGPFSKFTLVDWFNSNHKMFHFSYSTEEDCEQSEIDQFFQRVPDRKRGKQLGQYCFFGMTRAGD